MWQVVLEKSLALLALLALCWQREGRSTLRRLTLRRLARGLWLRWSSLDCLSRDRLVVSLDALRGTRRRSGLGLSLSLCCLHLWSRLRLQLGLGMLSLRLPLSLGLSLGALCSDLNLGWCLCRLLGCCRSPCLKLGGGWCVPLGSRLTLGRQRPLRLCSGDPRLGRCRRPNNGALLLLLLLRLCVLLALGLLRVLLLALLALSLLLCLWPNLLLGLLQMLVLQLMRLVAVRLRPVRLGRDLGLRPRRSLRHRL